MPIYEYECTQCGERFEVRQSIGEDGSRLNCPKCKAGNPKRLFSSFFNRSTTRNSESGLRKRSQKAKNIESDPIYSRALQAAEEVEKANEQLSQVLIQLPSY